jgi:mannosyltransferase
LQPPLPSGRVAEGAANIRVPSTAAAAPAGAGPLSRSDTSAAHRVRSHGALLGIAAIAAALRFATLGLQSYWGDEADTVDLLRRSLAHMLAALPNTDRTPPLYYALAWLWSRAFGSGEVGLRSLSAVAGTLTVVLAHAVGKRVAGERAGLIAASLTAASPILVWYSQEARSYSLLVFLSAASVWLWLRAQDAPSKGRVASWVVVACLAMSTHYFASFLVAFEALFLLRRHSRERRVWAALAVVALVQAALIPLAIHQAHLYVEGDYITSTSLTNRIVDVPKRFLLGEHGAPGATAVAFGAVLSVLLALAGWLFVRTLSAEVRRRSLPLLLLALVASVLPLALAVAGLDFFAYRNLLAVWILAAVVAAAALSTPGSRPAVAVAGGLVVTLLTLTIVVNLDPGLQRADWRFSPTALGRPGWARVIVITPSYERYPFQIYVGSARLVSKPTVTVREIDLVGYRLPAGIAPPQPQRGFRLAVRIDHQKLSFVRYIASRSTTIDVRRLRGLATVHPSALLQPAPKR